MRRQSFGPEPAAIGCRPCNVGEGETEVFDYPYRNLSASAVAVSPMAPADAPARRRTLVQAVVIQRVLPDLLRRKDEGRFDGCRAGAAAEAAHRG
jgi:hypothetical protein